MSAWLITDASTRTVRAGGSDSSTRRSVSSRKYDALAKNSSFANRKRTRPGNRLVLRVPVDAAELVVLVGARLVRRRGRGRRSAAGRRAGSARAARRSRRPRSRAARRGARRLRTRRSRAGRHPGRCATATGTRGCRRARSTAAMMIAASVACGSPSKSGVRKSIVATMQERDEQAGEPRPHAGSGSDGAAREARVDREALQQAGAEVRGAERDELLVRDRSRSRAARRASEPCRSTPPARRARARSRRSLSAPIWPMPIARERRSRQAPRHVRDHGDPVGLEVERAAGDDRDRRDDERPRHPRRNAPEHEQRARATGKPTSGVSHAMSSSDPISRHSISGTLPLSTVRPRSFGS